MSSRSRRRSSVFAAPTKAGVYGVSSHLPPRPICFAPNVTPVTYNESSDSSSPSTPEPLSPGSQPRLFPPSETPAPPPTRKRQPPGKRRSQGYIPRPPNAFMLFRADFVRQKHVPGSIETNHGSLSKIIGSCWRSLPIDEKKVWEQRAKQEKAAHKIQYPHYRFRPVHNKNKKKTGEGNTANSNTKSSNPAGDQQTFEEEIRCEEVTQLLLEGKKGEELAQALRDLDEKRREQLTLDSFHLRRSETPSTATSTNGPFPTIMSAPQPSYPTINGGLFAGSNNFGPLYMHRRSSSVPLPHHNPNAFEWNGGDYAMDSAVPYTYNTAFEFSEQQQHLDVPSANNDNIALPSVPFLPPPMSGGIAAQQRMALGHRRSSSAGAAFGGIQRSWTGMTYGAPFEGSNGMVDGSFNWGMPMNMSMGDDENRLLVLQRDDSALPDPNLDLFNPAYLVNGAGSLGASASQGGEEGCGPLDQMAGGSGGVMSPSAESDCVTVVGDAVPSGQQKAGAGASTTPNGCFNVVDLYNGLPPTQQQQDDLGPLDTSGLERPIDPADVQAQVQQQAQWASPPLPSATTPVEYEQMYLAQQEQEQAHHAFVMSGYEGVGESVYDMSGYSLGSEAGYEGAQYA